MAAALAACCLTVGRLAAQDECRPGSESNEAKTLAIFSVPLAFAPGAAPAVAQGRVRLTMEASYLPNVDDQTATPLICRPGKGPENTDLLPGFLRPRIQLALGGGAAVEASWVPPVRVSGVKANLIGLAIGWTGTLRPAVAVALRAHTTLGQINAPVTCPEEALADETSTCFDGTESDDRYRPNIAGADLTVGFGLPEARLRPYAGVGYSHLRPRFQVHFVDRQGLLDQRKVIVDLNRAMVFGGLTWLPGGRWAVTGEIYSAPADAVTGRVLLSLR